MDINEEKRAYSDWYAYTHELWMTSEQKAEKKRKQEWQNEMAEHIKKILEKERTT